MSLKKTIQYDDPLEPGVTFVVDVPAKHVVCDHCEGVGTVLNDAIRRHCYTWEEFNDTFHDDEDRAAYLEARGSKYHVACPACGGAKVLLVVDTAKCDRAILRLYIRTEARRVQADEEAASERLWESRMLGEDQ